VFIVLSAGLVQGSPVRYARRLFGLEVCTFSSIPAGRPRFPQSPLSPPPGAAQPRRWAVFTSGLSSPHLGVRQLHPPPRHRLGRSGSPPRHCFGCPTARGGASIQEAFGRSGNLRVIASAWGLVWGGSSPHLLSRLQRAADGRSSALPRSAAGGSRDQRGMNWRLWRFPEASGGGRRRPASDCGSGTAAIGRRLKRVPASTIPPTSSRRPSGEREGMDAAERSGLGRAGRRVARPAAAPPNPGFPGGGRGRTRCGGGQRCGVMDAPRASVRGPSGRSRGRGVRRAWASRFRGPLRGCGRRILREWAAGIAVVRCSYRGVSRRASRCFAGKPFLLPASAGPSFLVSAIRRRPTVCRSPRFDRGFSSGLLPAAFLRFFLMRRISS